MLAVEDVICELTQVMNASDGISRGLPPGFRFHPTDEELVTFYLAAKVFKGTFSGVDIAEIDLNRCEPWELPEVAKMGEKEWYFFSLRDRKYPTGLRTNRATGAGYWKATGKDRQVHSAATGALLGMKKTLVFYRGRAPRGEKTKWIMHEYRLDGHFSCRNYSYKDEWVICRIFHKTMDKKTVFLVDQALQQHRFPSLPELLDAPPPFPAPASSQQTPDLQIHARTQENPPVYPSADPLAHLHAQSMLLKSPEPVPAPAFPRQCKTESNPLPHIQDPVVIDMDNFYHQFNPCSDIPLLASMPFDLDKVIPLEGSWPAEG
ncbi:hypothetical protein MLD38_022154 [Melastoma candidum]|uniref:Uncharacterized protein n=1 Tax=Melastoma candidum TaxID=119954 RepID=A0ACB9QM87_9MYRT|nr:hypothetical protein MLD38_022154 [Melastoma candidum]